MSIVARTISRWEPGKLLLTLALAIALAWFSIVLMNLLRHVWFVDAQGRPLPIDFITIWVAGKQVLAGTPAAPYDFQASHLAQAIAAGHPFPKYYPWLYPPLFLFVAAALALLPYLAAFAAWIAASFACCVSIVAQIAKRREAALLAFVWPATLTNMINGQNGLLSCALIGGTLLFLETQPIVAGIFLGLLTYKPQLGLLFPIVLLADRRWSALISASITAVVVSAIVPYIVFGSAPFHAFLHALPQTEHIVLEQGMTGWNKQQTILGLVHYLGGNRSAWVLHAAVAAAATIVTVLLWRDRGAVFEIKAAALATGALVLTPYLYIYDLPVLLIPLAFLFRQKPFDRWEWTAVGAIYLTLLSFMWFAAPVGPVAILVTAAVIGRRVLQNREAFADGMHLQHA